MIVPKNISLGINNFSNESIKWEIVNACNHLVTNNVTLRPIAVKIGPFTNSGELSITKSLKFGFSLFCRVLLLAFFFVSVFISCSFDLVCFFAVISNWEALGYFSDWQQISLKTPTMRLTKVHHGKLNRQNRNKMGEDRQRKLTANHQQFNKWIKQLIGLEWNSF